LNSVLLDTSFLITLSDPTRPFHEAAKAYYKECIARRVPMYISTVAISEFQVKQSINDPPMRNFLVLPFNVDHAMACGLLVRSVPRDEADDRVRVKDDFKLIAQCQCESIDAVFSEDASTLTKYLRRMNERGTCTTKPLLLRDGFDPARFENGQVRLLP